MKNILLISVFVLVIAICSATTIYDVQYTTVAGQDGTYPSLFEGQEVTVTGIVTAENFNQFEDNFFIAMPESGAWKGLYVYAANTINTTNPIVAIGDEIEITGYIAEYYGYTELSGNFEPVTVTILSSGNVVPTSTPVMTADLVTADTAEQFESCLVEVHDVIVTEEQINFGQWYITDISAMPCQVDDGFFYLDNVTPPIVITLGMEWAVVRGCLDYSYDEYAINPRTPDDLIEELIPVVAEFSAEPLTGTVPLEVQFTDASVSNITSWEWDFESDGTIDSYEQNPLFTYPIIGTYTVSLTASDGYTTDTETKIDYIEVVEVLNADFTADPVSGIAPLEVDFTSTSTGNVTTWEWDFDNDGNIDSTEESPSYLYTETGDFSVSLTVGDGATTDTETKIDYISVGDLIVADFTADPLTGLAPLTVNFTNTSSGAIATLEWDFDNDGNIDSTDENPTYIYTEIGVYTVSLTVSDGTNTDTETKVDYIEVTEAETGAVVGCVYGGDIGCPLENAIITLGEYQTTSIADGSFYLELPVGIYQATISHPDYYTYVLPEDVVIEANQVIELEIILNPLVGTEDDPIVNPTRLIGNYPNPFNPETNIQFDIKEYETGILTIFNMKGQIVVSQSFNSGKYNYLWNAANCSSGVYFYQLQTESIIETKKMVLLK